MCVAVSGSLCALLLEASTYPCCREGVSFGNFLGVGVDAMLESFSTSEKPKGDASRNNDRGGGGMC